MKSNNITTPDWQLLKEIYKDNIDYAIQKLKDNYPIQYLIGYVDFLNCTINVNPTVLIPRFETELLIEKTIHFLKNKPQYKKGIDICTGSGAIAITIKKNINLNMSACDISIDALKIAQDNAKLNKVNINYFKIDILNEEISEKYDFIISNPPYVAYNEYTSPETKYEPSIALYANNNGLEFYEKIIKNAKDILNPGGSIIFEIGAKQAEDIKKIALSYFPNASIKIEKDYNKFDRYIFIEI